MDDGLVAFGLCAAALVLAATPLAIVLASEGTGEPQAPACPAGGVLGTHVWSIGRNEDAIDFAARLRDANWTEVGMDLPAFAGAHVWGTCRGS